MEVILVLALVFLAGAVFASAILTLPARTPPPPPTVADLARQSQDLGLYDEYYYPVEDFEPPAEWPPVQTEYRPGELALAKKLNKKG
jgi:hypothetical protein